MQKKFGTRDEVEGVIERKQRRLTIFFCFCPLETSETLTNIVHFYAYIFLEKVAVPVSYLNHIEKCLKLFFLNTCLLSMDLANFQPC